MTKKISIWDIPRSVAPWRIKLFKTFDHLVGGLITFLLPSLPKKAFPQGINSILIIRPGGIGDAVFLLPILRALKKQGCVIDILCEKRNTEVFNSQEHLVNLVYLYDEDHIAIFRNKYDLVVDTEQWHYLSALTTYFIRSRYKIGFTSRPRRSKLFHKVVEYDHEAYELDNFTKLFKDILIDGDVKGLEGSFEIPKNSQTWARDQIKAEFVTLFLGASIVLRRLNEKQLTTIIQHYLGKGFSVVLIGGNDVEDLALQIFTQIKSSQIYNFVGKISLLQSSALIHRSSLFIGPDSGFMHLACAINVPVVGIFGPGRKSKWGPKGIQHKIISENLPCSPCTTFGYTLPTCKGSYPCMKHESSFKGFNQNEILELSEDPT